MSVIKNIHAFEREVKLFTDTYKVDPSKISDKNFISEMMSDPRKTRRYIEEAATTNAYSCAEYAAQFVDLVNGFPRRELPYLFIGVKHAIKAILKADAEPDLKHKFADLDELCGKVLKTYAFRNDRGSGNAE